MGSQLIGWRGQPVILSLCDGLGSWSRPYVDAGYYVIRLDILTGDDVRLFELPRIPGRGRGAIVPIHGVLAAPPCTVFARAGNRWERSPAEIRAGLSVVDACLRIIMAASPKWWALENPSGKLVRYLGEPALRFNPCDYGDPYTKLTCLWGVFAPPIRNPVSPNREAHSLDHHLESIGHKLTKENRAQLRSQTPPGFARAFFNANP